MFLSFFRIVLLGSLSLGAKIGPVASLDALVCDKVEKISDFWYLSVALLSNAFQRSKEVVYASRIGLKGSCEAILWHPICTWKAIFWHTAVFGFHFFVYGVFLLFPIQGRLQYCDCWWWCHARGPLFWNAFCSIICMIGLAVSWICNAILKLRSFNYFHSFSYSFMFLILFWLPP